MYNVRSTSEMSPLIALNWFFISKQKSRTKNESFSYNVKIIYTQNKKRK